MRKLLLVAAILCSNSNILSTYGGKHQENEYYSDFKPVSKACNAFQNAVAEGQCKRTWLFFFTQVCNFSCTETGQISEEYCHICNDNEEYPCCNDLMCERENNAFATTTGHSPTDYSDEDEYEYDW